MMTDIIASGPGVMIPLIGLTGFLDGIHPCAIAILVFFMAFLLSLHRSMKSVLFFGIVYIVVIYITYLAIGLGFVSGIMLFGQHHFLAKVGSILLILLGLLSLRDYYLPTWKIGLYLPRISNTRIKKLLQQATLPAVILAAFFVALCSVPCSGGIYAAIAALLASQMTFTAGFGYLIFYNFMFVLPLIIILALSMNPLTLVKMGEWQQKHKKTQKLIMGLFMILIGLAILLFFV